MLRNFISKTLIIEWLSKKKVHNQVTFELKIKVEWLFKKKVPNWVIMWYIISRKYVYFSIGITNPLFGSIYV